MGRPCARLSATDDGSCWNAAIRAVAHPAARALAEVVVDARGRPGADENGDRFRRRHEARIVDGDADGVTWAQAPQQALLGDVPPAVAGAHAIGDVHAAGDSFLAEQIVHVLGKALHRPGADAVEHHRERQLTRVPQLGRATLERVAERAHARRDLVDRAPALADPRNRARDAAGGQPIAVALDAQRA